MIIYDILPDYFTHYLLASYTASFGLHFIIFLASKSKKNAPAPKQILYDIFDNNSIDNILKLKINYENIVKKIVCKG